MVESDIVSLLPYQLYVVSVLFQPRFNVGVLFNVLFCCMIILYGGDIDCMHVRSHLHRPIVDSKIHLYKDKKS